MADRGIYFRTVLVLQHYNYHFLNDSAKVIKQFRKSERSFLFLSFFCIASLGGRDMVCVE